MEQTPPKISIIIPTYNRSELVVRAVNSVLKQSYQDFEIILINNGSEDNTAKILKQYQGNDKIRLFTLEKNIRYVGAFNFGIKQIRGEWFSELADDDWLHEKALETLMTEVKRDPTITAISCNTKDNRTGNLLGTGVHQSQYLTLADVVGKTGGQFWGLAKSEFIGNLEMPKGIPGFESVFWYKIEALSKRYYIHKGLHLFNVDEHPTMTQALSAAKVVTKADSYQKLIKENFYWDLLEKYNKKQYLAMCLRGFLFLKIAGHKQDAKIYEQKILKSYPSFKYRFYSNFISKTEPRLLEKLYQLIFKINPARFFNLSIFGKHSHIVD